MYTISCCLYSRRKRKEMTITTHPAISCINNQYKLTSSFAKIKNEISKPSWGILCTCDGCETHNLIQMMQFENVSDSCEITVEIIKILRHNNVCLLHAEQIIEDFLINYHFY